MKKIQFYFFLLFSFANPGYSQTFAYYQILQSDTLFSLTNNTELQTIDFYFPYLQNFGTRKTALAVFPGTKQLTLQRKNDIKNLPPLFYARVYTKNIKKVIFYNDAILSERFITQINIISDGYQLPSEVNLDSLKIWLGKQDSLSIKIAYELKDNNQPFSLIIGDLYIGTNHIRRSLSPSKIFQHYPFANSKIIKSYETHPFDSYGIYAHFPANETEEDFKGTVLIEDSSKSSKELLSTIIVPLINHYPFYEEKRLDKKIILKEAVLLLKRIQGQSICDFTDSLNRFIISTFNDPHFRIRTECTTKKTLTPVYVYPINGKYLVGAVLDENLKKTIPLGSEVMEINGVSLIGNALPFKNEEIDRLFKREKGATINLKLKLDNGKIDTVSYTIKDKYTIAKGFKPKDLELRYLNDSTAYYKINKISNALQLDFINKLDSINTKRKLILDLRGNGGGDIIGAARFASYFINSSFKYYDLLDLASHKMDSVIVQTNSSPFHYRQDGQVIVLIDEATACAGELLASTLKRNNKNVTIIAKSASAGALAFVYEIVLPKDGIVISSNSLEPGKIFINGKVIEDKGVDPDTLVKINYVSDLQPYNDKVLKTAISK